jgi:hypothetical protein
MAELGYKQFGRPGRGLPNVIPKIQKHKKPSADI